MLTSKQNRNTWLFIGLFLLAGGINMLTGIRSRFGGALAFCLNFTIYIGLLIFWIQSIWERLLPTRSRTYILLAAGCMLLFLLLRVYRYRVEQIGVMSRLSAYAYSIPLALIMTFFLMTAVRIRRGQDGNGRSLEYLLLLPAALLSVLVLTNDLHFLAYRPHTKLVQFTVETGTYSHGPVFYMLYGYMGSALAVGLVLLFCTTKNYSVKGIFLIAAHLLAWFLLIVLGETIFNIHKIPHPYHAPETHIFGMLGLFEICIRFGLIPHNENYVGFFRAMELPAVITDRDLQPVFQTVLPTAVKEEQMRRAIREPVRIDVDTRLMGRPLRSGYVFWTEDESELHRLNAQLRNMGEILAEENELIEAENKLQEQQTYVSLRNRIYVQISEIMYPAQQRLADLVKNIDPEAPGFRDNIIRALVLGAYVKRGTNMMIADPCESLISGEELRLALQESAGYLQYRGLSMQITSFQEETIRRQDAFNLYTTFEQLMEAWDPLPSKMSVSFSDRELRLVTDDVEAPVLSDAVLPVRVRHSDDLLYLTISAEGGGQA